MSVITIKIEKNQIVMASDSQKSWGGNKLPKEDNTDGQINAVGKIYQVNGMALGLAGSCAHIGLLQIYAKTNKPKIMDKDSVMDWFIGFKEWATAKAKIGWNEISIHGIICSEGVAFEFFDFLDVNRITKYSAVGSGMWLALGAFECGASAKKAVEVACVYDKGCGGEVHEVIIKTKNNE